MSDSATKMKRKLNGVVVSDKMDKTVVVRVDRTVLHSKYLKRFTKSRRFQVHDPENTAKNGDLVTITQMRPVSKNKCWRIVDNASVSA